MFCAQSSRRFWPILQPIKARTAAGLQPHQAAGSKAQSQSLSVSEQWLGPLPALPLAGAAGLAVLLAGLAVLPPPLPALPLPAAPLPALSYS